MTVSVICLCYNQARFVREAIQSVFAQTHAEVQLVVVDDGSTDDSVSVIRAELRDKPNVEVIINSSNLGNCAAFNKGWAKCTGNFIIDLAADDILMPNRIAVGLAAFESYSSEYGVHFSDAEYISEGGDYLGLHSDRFPNVSIPQGDIYLQLIDRYFVCSPTMMICRHVLEKLNGYDESLAYEDFDFWIRSGREFKYGYSSEPLVRKRVVGSSMGKRQHRYGSAAARTTYLVCEKVMALNRSREEANALDRRIRYEIRKSIQFGNWKLAKDYLKLLFKNKDYLRLSSPERMRK